MAILSSIRRWHFRDGVSIREIRRRTGLSRDTTRANPAKIAQSNFQFRWILCAPDNETALWMAKQFTLQGVAERITCPILITHGANDRVVPVQAAHDLYRAVVAPRKTLRNIRHRRGRRGALPGRQPPSTTSRTGSRTTCKMPSVSAIPQFPRRSS